MPHLKGPQGKRGQTGIPERPPIGPGAKGVDRDYAATLAN